MNLNDAFNSLLYCPEYKPLRKIKVTTDFYLYLVAKYQNEAIYKTSDEYKNSIRWHDIPIEIDDTIENEYYELVY